MAASAIALANTATGVEWVSQASGYISLGTNRSVYVYLRNADGSQGAEATVYATASLSGTPLTQPLSAGAQTGALPGYVVSGQSLLFVDALTNDSSQAEAVAAADLVGNGTVGGGNLPLPSSVVNGGSAASPIGSALYLPFPSGDTSGATDLAKLNQVLAQGGTIRPNPLTVSPLYYINAPLVTASGGNTDIDWGAATVELVSGSNCNMLTNYSQVNSAASGTGSMTDGSNTVTSAVAVSVGQTAIVAGAGGNGNGPLVGVVASVGSGTFTLNTLDGRACNCTNPSGVSAATVTVYNRETNIKSIGGTWERGSNAGSGIANHSLLFRHVDHLTVEVRNFTSTGGKYAISVGDVSNFTLSAKNINSNSDGIHIDGPAFQGTVPEIRGTTGDDSVALTCAEYAAYADTSGDIIGVSVGDIATNTSQGHFKVLAGAGWLADKVKLTGQITGNATNYSVWIGDDSAQAATTGGTYGDIDFGTCAGNVTTAGHGIVLIYSPSAERIRGRLRYTANAVALQAGIYVEGSSTATIGSLEIDLTLDGSLGYAYAPIALSASTVTVTCLKVTGYSNATKTGQKLIQVVSGTIGRLHVDANVTMTGNGGDNVVFLNSAGSILSMVFDGTYYDLNSLCSVQSGYTGTTQVQIRCDVKSANIVLQLNGGTWNVRLLDAWLGLNNEIVSTTGATVRVIGTNTNTAGVTTILRSASESISVNGLGLKQDLATLTPQEGDMVYDSSSRTAALGVAIYHSGGTGNGWKNLYTGGTY